MIWLALAASPILFGLGDFFGGVLSRRVSSWAVVGVTSGVSALFALIWALTTRSVEWDLPVIAVGAMSGVLYLVGYVLFFQALTLGKAGVVGAIVTLALVPPVLADVVRGDLPSAIQLAGIAAIGVGVIVISEPGSIGSGSKRCVAIAILAAAVLGTQFVLLDRASQADPDLAVVTQYAVAALAVALLGITRRSNGGITRTDLPRLVGVGLAFGLAGLCFAAAMSGINVAVVSAVVLTEPFVLAILGYVVKGERLSVAQSIALVVIIAGAVVTSVG